jgi:hypothetical protein
MALFMGDAQLREFNAGVFHLDDKFGIDEKLVRLQFQARDVFGREQLE